MITSEELFDFLQRNAEQIDGQTVSRVSIAEELRRLGVERPYVARRRLVSELESRGLVRRPDPRSRRLILNKNGRLCVTADVQATKARAVQLRSYMTRNVLRGGEFICSSQTQCRSSLHPGCSFTEAQLSHLGKHFDIHRDGTPMRVVVVGQEVGATGSPRRALAARYRDIHDASGMSRRFDSDEGHKRRNPHMRGTTLALRVIFGKGPGRDREGEFLDLGDGAAHLFDCFSLVNRLICSAHTTGTSGGRPTSTMLDNCERHFAATLSILEPTLIVIQGVKVWQRSKGALPIVSQVTNHLVETRIGDAAALVCTFTHPSARGVHRWDSPESPYFRSVVHPTLTEAVARLSA
jgi:uracil-DNA glycosylase